MVDPTRWGTGVGAAPLRLSGYPAGGSDSQGDADRAVLAGSKILLVEDEFVIALDFQILLYRFGCEVLGPVGSVAEAMVLLRHDKPDAALLDINLRDGVVLPVVERLQLMSVPYVLVTARDTSQLAHPLLENVPSLNKPVDEHDLRRGIARLLRPG